MRADARRLGMAGKRFGPVSSPCGPKGISVGLRSRAALVLLLAGGLAGCSLTPDCDVEHLLQTYDMVCMGGKSAAAHTSFKGTGRRWVFQGWKGADEIRLDENWCTRGPAGFAVKAEQHRHGVQLIFTRGKVKYFFAFYPQDSLNVMRRDHVDEILHERGFPADVLSRACKTDKEMYFQALEVTAEDISRSGLRRGRAVDTRKLALLFLKDLIWERGIGPMVRWGTWSGMSTEGTFLQRGRYWDADPREDPRGTMCAHIFCLATGNLVGVLYGAGDVLDGSNDENEMIAKTLLMNIEASKTEGRDDSD